LRFLQDEILKVGCRYLDRPPLGVIEKMHLVGGVSVAVHQLIINGLNGLVDDKMIVSA
jgi:hypothetical protein